SLAPLAPERLRAAVRPVVPLPRTVARRAAVLPAAFRAAVRLAAGRAAADRVVRRLAAVLRLACVRLAMDQAAMRLAYSVLAPSRFFSRFRPGTGWPPSVCSRYSSPSSLRACSITCSLGTPPLLTTP